MSWFEAWLIWRLGAIHDLFGVICGISSFGFIFCIAAFFSSKSNDIKEPWRNLWKKLYRLSAPIFILMFILSTSIIVILPDTATLFKIIATKYGADALTSQRAEQIGDNVLDSIEKAQKVIDQKLDRLIDKEKPKESK